MPMRRSGTFGATSFFDPEGDMIFSAIVGNATSGELPLWHRRPVLSVVSVPHHDYGKGRPITSEYERVEKRDQCRREFGAKDTALGWIIYGMASLYLIV